MAGNRHRQQQKASPRGVDFLDRVFEWSEKTFCPHNVTKDSKEPEEDLLDYVFEHVESFTCKEEKEAEPNVLMMEHMKKGGLQYQSMERNNSLVEADSRGRPAHLSTQRKVRGKGQGDGDMLDYVFENAESFVCGEDGPGRAKSRQADSETTDVTYKAAKQRLQNLYEPEDEIQLYYKPRKSRS